MGFIKFVLALIVGKALLRRARRDGWLRQYHASSRRPARPLHDPASEVLG